MAGQLGVDRVGEGLGPESLVLRVSVPGCRCTHALQGLGEEHRFEFLRDAFQLGPLVAPGRRSCEGGSRPIDEAGDVGAHRITSSARSAPDALSACMMAMMSRGLAPSTLSARTTSASVGPASRV